MASPGPASRANQITALIAAGNYSSYQAPRFPNVHTERLEKSMTAPSTKNAPAIDRLLTPEETAAALGVSISWLAKARLTGTGSRFVKIGRSVRYPETYIRDYVRQRTRSSTSEI